MLTAITKISNLLDTLKGIMASGYDPTFSYIYDNHRIAYLQLNAVTVEAETVDPLESRGSDAVVVAVEYEILVTIRVHLAYAQQAVDYQDAMALMNSIEEYLNKNRNLGDNYRIRSIAINEPPRTFEESASFGGQLDVIVQHYKDYEQA